MVDKPGGMSLWEQLWQKFFGGRSPSQKKKRRRKKKMMT